MSESDHKAVAMSKGASGKSRRRWIWFGAIVLACVIFAWLEPDEDDLFELCSTQGKPVIYRSVVAEGYYDGATDNCWGCWGYLSNTDYKFIEFSLNKKRLRFDPITEPGIYRVSRIDAGSSSCHEKLTAFYTKTAMQREEFERNNWCFQVERFESRQARYGYYSQGLGVIKSSPLSKSSISANHMFYVDHEMEEVVAEATNFSLGKYPFIGLSSFRNTKHCNTYIDELGPRGLNKQSVVRPFKEAQQ